MDEDQVTYEEYDCARMINVYREQDVEWFWCAFSAKPYINCYYRCEYCYARKFDNLAAVRVKKNAVEMFRRDLAKIPKPGIIGLGDWQPCEAQYQLMRGILQACIDYRFPVHIIQKSTLVLRDLDLLQELASKTWVTVSFSICGVDEAVTGVMEPFAPTALERIEAMGTLVEAGVHAGVSYMPILPYLCDTWEAIEETVALVAEHRGEYVIPAGLTLSGPQRDHYFGILQVHWPHLVDPYDHIYPVGRSYGPVGYEINPYHRVAKVAAQYGVRVGLAAPSYPTDPIIPGQSRLDAFMRI